MRVLLLQIDGKIPNIALMRIAAHHRSIGDEIELRYAGNPEAVRRNIWDRHEKVYASLIFERSRPVAEALLSDRPEAIVGGTGWDMARKLEDYGITTNAQDYSLYPNWAQSIGFTQRGCRLRCGFCVVPRKEGAVKEISTVNEIWRGEPWPKEVILLDNDFFGQIHWADRINEIKDGNFKVSFNQGINARFLTEETAAAIASVDYRDDQMKTKRIYTAWDNAKDEERLFHGLELLTKNGVKPRNIMVYMLIGYWPNETHADRDNRRSKLRTFGCLPYPMPYIRTPELTGFQRWVIGAYDKRVPWDAWAANKFQPRGLEMTAVLSAGRGDGECLEK